uniref:Uncharacterized protein n=1 Tax=Anguilla anguilla TaxID=7936 RepID=A0A0E9TRS4_ANGAN
MTVEIKTNNNTPLNYNSPNSYNTSGNPTQ